MSTEIMAAAVGGAIAIIASLGTAVVNRYWDTTQKRKSICAVAGGELAAMCVALRDFKHGQISPDELKATTPLLVSIAQNLGYLSMAQAMEYRVAITMFSQLKKSDSGERTDEVLKQCEKALHLIKNS